MTLVLVCRDSKSCSSCHVLNRDQSRPVNKVVEDINSIIMYQNEGEGGGCRNIQVAADPGSVRIFGALRKQKPQRRRISNPMLEKMTISATFESPRVLYTYPLPSASQFLEFRQSFEFRQPVSPLSFDSPSSESNPRPLRTRSLQLFETFRQVHPRQPRHSPGEPHLLPMADTPVDLRPDICSPNLRSKIEI